MIIKVHSSLARLSIVTPEKDEAGSLCAPAFTHMSCTAAGCKETAVSSRGRCEPKPANPTESKSLKSPGRPILRAVPALLSTSFEQLDMQRVSVTQEKRSSADPTSVSVAPIDPHLEPIVVHLAHVGVPFERPGGHDPETRPPLTLTGQCYGRSVHALIDSGATCNFISKALVGELVRRGKPIEVLTSGRRMSLTLGDGSARECNQSVAGVPLHLGFGSHSLQECLDARVTELMPEYDVLLGTPWLHKHNPGFDWHTGAISIKRKGGRTPVTLQGLPIPAMKAEVSVVAQNAAQGVKPLEFISAPPLIEVETNGEPERTPVRSASEAVFVRDNADLFVAPTGLPPLRHINHEIDLQPGSKAPYRPAYRLAQSELDELNKQMAKLLELGHIRKSRSAFGAPVLFVSKKSGEKRMCVDYRDLNKISVRNPVAMPRPDDLMDRLAGKKVFSTIDMVSAFHQVRIEPGHEHKTGFNTRLGHYEFLVTPFGMINSPATLQTLLNDIFSEYLDDFMVIYLDDMLIFSDSVEDHTRHLALVAAVLRKQELRLSLKKCHFFQEKVEFLGHFISEDGVSMDPLKVEAVRNWPPPSNVTHIKQFLGLASFYRRFIDKFSFISTVLSDLTKKDVPWEWGLRNRMLLMA